MPLSRSDVPARKLLWRLLLLGFEYRWPALGLVSLQLLLVTLSLSALGLTGLGIDYIRHLLEPSSTAPQWPGGWQPPEGWAPLRVLACLSASVFLLALVTASLRFAAAVASASFSQRMLIRVRTDVYEKLQRLSFHFYDAGETSSIINRAAGDANAVRGFIDGVLIRLITVGLTLSVYLVYMLQVHVPLTLVCLASTPLLWWGGTVFSRIVQPAYCRASELGDAMVRILVESIQGIHVIKGFASQPQQIARFRDATQQIRQQKEAIFWKISSFQPLMGLVTQANMLILIVYGGMLVIRGELQLGAGLFVFANLLQEFAAQVSQIVNIANTVQSSVVSARRVFEVLDAPLQICQPAGAIRLNGARGGVQFDGVHFAYRPGQPVQQDLSFQVAPGRCLAITGETGSGKSTLLSLIMRFYDVDQGSILVDGHDVRRLDLDDLRRNAGIVFQDSFLFSNTVAANIAFGHPGASFEQVQRAARIAAADDFIAAMPDGYESIVGEYGSNLSGGQRQRLALARALLMDPPLLLLDDVTASVDSETEHEIREALLSAMRGRTTVLVSNRLSALRRADRILVLAEGRISAEGTHEELLRDSAYYRHLAELQYADAADQLEPAAPIAAPSDALGAAEAAGRGVGDPA